MYSSSSFNTEIRLNDGEFIFTDLHVYQKISKQTYQLEKFFHRVTFFQILVLNPLLICQSAFALVISPNVVEINHFSD